MTPRGQARRIALLEERVAALEEKMPTINTPLGGECDGVPCWPSVPKEGDMNEQAGSKETTMALTELYDKAYRSGLRDGQERMREHFSKGGLDIYPALKETK